MLGLSSSYFAFKGKGIYDSVKAVFDMGFETVELGAGHSFEPRALEAVKRVKRDFPEKNYTVHGLFPPLREKLWFNSSLGLTPQNRRIISGLFKAAEITEARVVSVHPGFLSKVGYVEKKPGMLSPKPLGALQKEKSVANFFKVVEFALAKSRETGAIFAVENINATRAHPLLLEVGDFRRVFKRFPQLGMLLDFGHALFAQNTGELLDNFAPRIVEAHLHWSAPRSKTHAMEDHLPLKSEKQLAPLRGIRQFQKIPLIFEHGPKVVEKQILGEKRLVESFEKNLGLPV